MKYTSMRVHYLQHVSFEGLGSIETVLMNNGHTISVTRMFKSDSLPDVSELDWLIVMGGPMGVQDELQYAWLKTEKQFIRETIQAGKIVLGICLGAQLIAEVLGAKVYKNKFREIGWFDIKLNPALKHTIFKGVFSERCEVFHWHDDTFDIPNGALSIGSSEATHNQGFVFENRVIALQFHLETTPASAKALVENCQSELDGSKFVQNEQEIMNSNKRFDTINIVMYKVIKAIVKGSKI